MNINVVKGGRLVTHFLLSLCSVHCFVPLLGLVPLCRDISCLFIDLPSCSPLPSSFWLLLLFSVSVSGCLDLVMFDFLLLLCCDVFDVCFLFSFFLSSFLCCCVLCCSFMCLICLVGVVVGGVWCCPLLLWFKSPKEKSKGKEQDSKKTRGKQEENKRTATPNRKRTNQRNEPKQHNTQQHHTRKRHHHVIRHQQWNSSFHPSPSFRPCCSSCSSPLCSSPNLT